MSRELLTDSTPSSETSAAKLQVCQQTRIGWGLGGNEVEDSRRLVSTRTKIYRFRSCSALVSRDEKDHRDESMPAVTPS